MKRPTVLAALALSAFIFLGAGCPFSGSDGSPSPAEIAQQQRIEQIEKDLLVANQRTSSLSWQLEMANEDLAKLTDPEQIAQGKAVIADMEAQRDALAATIAEDEKKRELAKIDLAVLEATRIAAEAHAKASTGENIESFLSFIPQPWGSIGTAVFGVVGLVLNEFRRKSEAAKVKAQDQRDANIRATDLAKTSVVRDPATGRVKEFTVSAAKLEEVQAATPGLTAAVKDARA